MTEKLIIAGGMVVSPFDVITADVLIKGQSITGVVMPGSVQWEDAQVIDATGKYVLPGLVDPHTHIQLDTGIFKTADNWEIGSKVAVYGGVTTVVDFATQFPGETFAQALQNRLGHASSSYIDYSFHMMITDPPAEDDAYRLALEQLRDSGIPSIKLYTTYRPNYYMDDGKILRTFRAMPDEMLALIHCENDAIVSAAGERLIAAGNSGWAYHGQARPPEAENEAVARMLQLSSLVGAKVYIVHCSDASTIELILNSQHYDPSRVWFETCTQYFTLDDTSYRGESPEKYILQPPLRSAGSMQQMKHYALDVDVISTDHCDYTIGQKREFDTFARTPGGLPGLETSLQLTFTALSSLSFDDRMKLIAEKMSMNPAKIFGLYPRKGSLLPGSDADVVIYDPNQQTMLQQEHLHSIGGYSPYEGNIVQGIVQTTISRGSVLLHDDIFNAEQGRGIFLKAGSSVDLFLKS